MRDSMVASKKYDYQPKALRLFQGGVPLILEKLGLGEGDWKIYVRHLQNERTKLLMWREMRGRKLVCGTVQVNLERECVRGTKVKKVVTIM